MSQQQPPPNSPSSRITQYLDTLAQKIHGSTTTTTTTNSSSSPSSPSSSPSPSSSSSSSSSPLSSISTSLSSLPATTQILVLTSSGLLLESTWHVLIERRYLKTPTGQIRASLRRAWIFWPAAGVGMLGAVKWAEGRVGRRGDGGDDGLR